MKVDKKQVEYVANLSRINIPEKDVEFFAEQLNMILDYMEKLNDLDVTDVEPTSHVIKLENVYREDSVKESLKNEDALLNAPDKKEVFFKVPKVIGD